MKIAVISTYTHPTRLPRKERGIMQSSVPELIASLCPDHAEVEVYNEKELDIPLDRDWDLVFFSYLHSYYEHTKVLSTLLRRRGIKTVAGGRHAVHFADDCESYFDAVVTGEPESNVPALIADFERGELKKRYNLRSNGPEEIRPYRYDLVDFKTNRIRLPGIEASRGCPFTCNTITTTRPCATASPRRSSTISSAPFTSRRGTGRRAVAGRRTRPGQSRAFHKNLQDERKGRES